MVGLVTILTQKAILLESDMLGTLIVCYMYLFLIIFVSFVNIYSVDKHEFLNNIQQCIEFKSKVFFIIYYSKHKHIVSLKTFVMELIGYMLIITMVVAFLISLNLEISVALVLVAVLTLVILAYGCVTGNMFRKTKRKK